MEWVDLGGPNDIGIEFLPTPDRNGGEAIKSQGRQRLWRTVLVFWAPDL